jgi:CheY-like chemotaxis protein
MARILCVDDNAVFLQSMVERLQAEHYEVDHADSPGAALTAFKQSPFKYDVVLTDMDFPSGDDGEMLIAELVELREKRGYDPAPEIICITGARSKMDPMLVNRLRDKGCQYVLKGTDQYFIEAQAAMKRLQDVRTKGPIFLFAHAASADYKWDDTQKWGCVVGESVAEVCLLHSGRRINVKLGPAPRRLFDFFARRASMRAFSVEEVANALSLDEFYSYWESGDETVTSNSVKTNVNRIRVALQATFKGMNLPFKPSDVLSSETYEDTTELLLEKTRHYRFRARAVVEHLP